MWHNTKDEAPNGGEPVWTEPKKPNYSSFRMDTFGGEYCNITGSQNKPTTSRSIMGNIKRQIRLSGYDTFDKKEKYNNTIFLPLETLKELKNIIIKVDDNIDIVATVSIYIDDDGEVSTKLRS